MVKREAKIRPRLLQKAVFWGSLSSMVLSPSPVWSQITQIPLTLYRQPNEEFNTFVQRATVLTSETLKQGFENNKNLNQLRVVVMGVNNGDVAPLLAVTMSREQWRGSGDVSPHINYFPDSQALLNFQTPPPLSAPSSAPALAQPPLPSTPPGGSNPSPVDSNTNPEEIPPQPSPTASPHSILVPSASPLPPSLYNRFRGNNPSP